MISRRGFEFFHKKKGLFLFEILRFALCDKYNRGFGGKAPEDSSHLIIRVFLFRFCFFFFHRNKKEKVNISLSVGLAKPTYLFLIYISLFNQTLSPTHKPLTKQFTGLFCSAKSKERGIAVFALIHPSSYPQPLSKQFSGLFCSAESLERGRNIIFFTGKKQPLKIKTAFIIY